MLTSAGVEAEAELPFAGLHQLLWPIIDLADELPEVQSHALRGAFGLSADRVEDRFLVSVAVLGLLNAAADAQPLVCVIDDAHWLDGASADALRLRRPAPAGRSDRRAHGGARGRRARVSRSWTARAGACRAARRRSGSTPRWRPARGRAGGARGASPAATRSPCSSCPPRSPTTSFPAAPRCGSTCRSTSASSRRSWPGWRPWPPTRGGCSCWPRPTTAARSGRCCAPRRASASGPTRSMRSSVLGCCRPMARECASAIRSCARPSTAPPASPSAGRRTRRWPPLGHRVGPAGRAARRRGGVPPPCR